MSQFLWGLPWDAQRIGGQYHDEFRDFATVAIGMYAAAAGIQKGNTLAQENIAAMMRRRFKGEAADQEYSFLVKRNTENTGCGYDLYNYGLVGPGDH